MHTTLRHFLQLCLQPDIDMAAVVSAAELDPAILVTLLGAAPGVAADLGRWYETFDLAMLQAMAIAMGASAVAGGPEPDSLESAWREAVLRSLIAAGLANRVDGADVAEARLTALVSTIGQWLQPAGSASGAAYLAALGCRPAVCEAVRYQDEPMEQLDGTAPLLQVNGIAGHLLPYATGPDMLGGQDMPRLRALTGLDEDDLYNIMGHAARAFTVARQHLDEKAASAPDLPELVAGANIGAVFYRAFAKGGKSQPFAVMAGRAGRLLFGFTGICHFMLAGEDLIGVMDDGQRLRIDAGRAGSAIAAACREQRMVIVARREAHDLIERQLMDRFQAESLLCLPLGDSGLLACGTDKSFTDNIERSRVMLDAFAESAADLHARSAEDEEIISLGELHRRVREITHEVNNPLAIVQNYLRSLSIKLGEDTPVQKDIDAIAREITRVGGIVQKYARIGRDDELELRRVDLNALIEELVAIVRGGAGNLVIETHLDDTIPVMELAADALRQVILNILKNAAEALTGSAGARIDISTQGAVNVNGKHYIEIVVSDNGPGMSQEQRLALFNGTASTKGEGRGLGLGIVRQLLDRMSATIACRENMTSSGTTFQVLLPLDQD